MSLSLTRCKGFAGSAGPLLALVVLLQACSSPPRAPDIAVTPAARPTALPAPVEAAPESPRHVSTARTPDEYRQHAARHVYDYHAAHIFSGPMPPLLQAVGVLDIEIGEQGEVRRLNWLRPPAHVPEVMRQIEQLIQRAAPYPAPLHLRSVTYTDTWLWHQSGRFQLHTLSEGQLGVIEITASQEPKRQTARRNAPAPSSRRVAKCAHPSSPANPSPAYC